MTREEAREEVLKGLECCVDFCCNDCPYHYLDSKEYPIRCIHSLLTDVHNLIKESKQQ